MGISLWDHLPIGAFISVILPFGGQSEQSFGDLEPIGGIHSTIIIHWGTNVIFWGIINHWDHRSVGALPFGIHLPNWGQSLEHVSELDKCLNFGGYVKKACATSLTTSLEQLHIGVTIVDQFLLKIILFPTVDLLIIPLLECLLVFTLHSLRVETVFGWNTPHIVLVLGRVERVWEISLLQYQRWMGR